MTINIIRPQISQELLKQTFEKLFHRLNKRLEKHGAGSFISKHEIYGAVMEEVYEMSQAIRDDKSDAFYEELEDVAIGCIFGIASKNILYKKEEEISNVSKH